jgi:FkbM family methyltransferase
MYDFTNKYICLVLTCNKPAYVQRRTKNNHIYDKIHTAGFEIIFLYADSNAKELHIKCEENGYYTMTVPTKESYMNLSMKMWMAYSFFANEKIKGILKVDDDIYYIENECLDLEYFNVDYLGINEGDHFNGPFYWVSNKAIQYINSTSIHPNSYGPSEDIFVGKCLLDKEDIIRYKTKWYLMEYIKYSNPCIRYNPHMITAELCNVCDECMLMKKYYTMHFKNETGEYFDHRKTEITEQLQVEKYIEHDSIVLELGARFGTVSCIINKKISNPAHQVSVEPDVRVQSVLYENMIENECNFHIVNGFISNNSMILTDINSYDGYGATSEKSNSSSIPSYTLEEIETKYNLKFNTLVADCEGFLEQFFDENPQLYSQLSLVMFEKDCPEKCNYELIINNLKLHNFKQLESGFHEVWKRQ